MSTRNRPQREEKERSTGDLSPSLNSLFMEMTKMTTLLCITTDVLTIKETMTELKTTVQEQLSEAKTCIVPLEESAEQSHTDKDKKSKLLCRCTFKL